MANYNETVHTTIGNGYANELRSVPGYTNYVVGVNKNLSGTISSAKLKRYYSSIDAEIYLNGEWVEDIASISWNISQQTMPLFGYNSYVWDDISQGSRIISGNFTIVLTDPMLIDKAISNTKIEGQTKLDYEEVQEKMLSQELASPESGGEITENEKYYHIWEASGNRRVESGFKVYKGFDIDIVCGEKEPRGGNSIHIILKNCVIKDMGTIRESSNGSPAIEQYSFMAQDFIRIS